MVRLDGVRFLSFLLIICVSLTLIGPTLCSGEECSREEIMRVPFFGEINISEVSLPLLTFIIAGMDGFNPCAFFVLFLLLSILLYARSRKIMLIIGGVFVLFSGVIYFIFMSAWLNFFLIVGQLRTITVVAGVSAGIMAIVNIKDFFFFRKGPSLVIPEWAKPGLLGRARGLLRKSSTASMILGTIVLAIAANSYEVLCTAGFPMIYARALTLRRLPTAVYYLYLALYNVIYVIPLMVIVLIFSFTLGARKLRECQGRALKLISGLMMLGLGTVLLTGPELLNNILVPAGLLVLSLSLSYVIGLISKAVRRKSADSSRKVP